MDRGAESGERGTRGLGCPRERERRTALEHRDLGRVARAAARWRIAKTEHLLRVVDPVDDTYGAAGLHPAQPPPGCRLGQGRAALGHDEASQSGELRLRAGFGEVRDRP
ncbi:hypothetical protein FSY75_06010 [Streptomyces sp. TR1341]|nr:hypothetical protein [Streptomyces sp. TR1341]